MELVIGKVFQTYLTGFLVGGGLTMFRNMDDRIYGRFQLPESSSLAAEVHTKTKSASTPAQESMHMPPHFWRNSARDALIDGLKTGGTVGLGAGVFGICSLARWGRSSERFFQPRGDGLSVFAGLAAGAFMYMPSSPGYQRLAYASGVGLIGALFAESLPSPASVMPP
jgi:hypothetical protein